MEAGINGIEKDFMEMHLYLFKLVSSEFKMAKISQT